MEANTIQLPTNTDLILPDISKVFLPTINCTAKTATMACLLSLQAIILLRLRELFWIQESALQTLVSNSNWYTLNYKDL